MRFGRISRRLWRSTRINGDTVALQIQRVGLYGALIFAWEYASGGFGRTQAWLDPLLFGRPSQIIADLWQILHTGSILPDLLITLIEALGGLLLGITLGVMVGFIFTWSERIEKLLNPLMAAINGLPRPALAPLFVLWLGFGVASKVLLSFSLVFFVILYNVLLGLRSIDGALFNAVRIMGAGRTQMIRFVILPSVFSWVFAALRTSVGYALIGAVLGELVGATGGLGYRLLIAEGLLATERVFSILILLAVTALALTQVSQWVENRVLKWKPAERIKP